MNITLTIAGQRLKLKVTPDEEFVYREAARKLNKRIDFFNNTFPKTDYRIILTVVALEKAIESESGLSQTDGMIEKIHEWSDTIDRVITEK
ncbi:MAG: cell division protein ZapA [Paludibacteraceae bacterium]